MAKRSRLKTGSQVEILEIQSSDKNRIMEKSKSEREKEVKLFFSRSHSIKLS